MPQLKQISCCIQWADTGAPFQEYGVQYGDGVVEAYMAVPSKPQKFTVHLRSHGYIAEGLCVVVFIDGNYQCNRSRLNLVPAQNGDKSKTEVNFLLRQKEKAYGDDMYIGREWRFDDHNIGEYSIVLSHPSRYESDRSKSTINLKTSRRSILKTSVPSKFSSYAARLYGGLTSMMTVPRRERTAISWARIPVEEWV